MDRDVGRALEDAGLRADFEETFPILGIRLDDVGRVVPLGDEATVVAGERSVAVRLKKSSELIVGDTVPLDIARGPTPEYVPFFGLIERTAADFCSVARARTRDQEFERLYNHLRPRPDGTDPNPLFSYLQGAARLYMSLHDVSRAEYEAVVQRLTKSARTFSEGASSTNYTELVLECFLA